MTSDDEYSATGIDFPRPESNSAPDFMTSDDEYSATGIDLPRPETSSAPDDMTSDDEYSATGIDFPRRESTTATDESELHESELNESELHERERHERERDRRENEIWLRAVLAAEDRERRRLPPELLLGRGLLRLRLYMRWSQRDVERASGVSQSTISRLETGVASNVGSARISAVLRALNADDVVILPRLGTVEPTALERMLRGDPWKRAVAEADRRVNLRRSA